MTEFIFGSSSPNFDEIFWAKYLQCLLPVLSDTGRASENCEHSIAATAQNVALKLCELQYDAREVMALFVHHVAAVTRFVEFYRGAANSAELCNLLLLNMFFVQCCVLREALSLAEWHAHFVMDYCCMSDVAHVATELACNHEWHFIASSHEFESYAKLLL